MRKQRAAGFAVTLIAAILSLISSCQYPAEYFEFRKLSLDEQHAKFRTFPFEKQIDFHLLSMVNEPPDSRFSEDIASRGNEALPVLINRINAEREDYRRVDLMVVFVTMHQRFLNLAHNRNVLEALRQIVPKMENKTWKAMFRENLAFISDPATGLRQGESDPLHPIRE
jgi:hypothetical protein